MDPNLRATIAAFGTRTLARPRGPSDQEVAIRPDAPGPGHYDSPEIRKILAAFAAGELALLPGQLVPHTICQLAETPPEKRASSDPASITPEEQKEGPS